MSDSEVEFPPNEEQVALLRERYRCPHFRILVIGRANAGKTTILEKVCRVARGTIPIIYDKEGKPLQPTLTHLIPSIERGIHDIEHQITYKGSNFIFHDSQGFESGATDELNVAWGFIDKKSAESELRNQLHAIWYCIPMDSPRPLLHTELQFFQKGTGKVPLVVVFTKFDGQIVNEYVNMKDAENYEDKWDLARVKADDSFQRIYLPKVLDTEYPPKAFVRLADMDLDENDCPELTEQTAGALDDDIIQQLFISTQMNNLDLCVKTALQHTLSSACRYDTWIKQTPRILNKFPHYWVQ
ncbi:hypothetical protein F5887DRAFT_960972 [Amanita rubescens]|nr:hypothetical protein F5887DRAFT_968361 [Amanita rubescens]KAF8346256.1 hypothetical protein F5887DRAFT_960972 [Amanita rubescens]